MENDEEKKEAKNENEIKEENDKKTMEGEKQLVEENKEKEKVKNNNENKEESISDKKEEENSNIKEIKDDNKENENNTKDKKQKDETIDPHLIFQKELLNIIQKQEKILTSTSTLNEKFGISNEITKEQIASFKTNIDKYGKYLIMIKKELGIISDTMKKIKKLAKVKEGANQK